MSRRRLTGRLWNHRFSKILAQIHQLVEFMWEVILKPFFFLTFYFVLFSKFIVHTNKNKRKEHKRNKLNRMKHT